MAKKTAPVAKSSEVSMKAELQDHHKAFSHIMYGLFLVAITFAAFYTLNALSMLSSYSRSEYFYPIVAIMMLLWAFLFWEFGHRVHTA